MSDQVTETEQTDSVAAPRARPRNPELAKRLLRRKQGATIAELTGTTAWQPHSARAFLTGLRKAGKTLEKDKRKSGVTSYRLVRR